MPTEFTLPSLGENIESVRIVAVRVSPGEAIKADQTVLELETDKAMMELPSPVDGVVKSIHVKENDDIQLGQLILTIETDSSVAAKSEKADATSTDAASLPEESADIVQPPHMPKPIVQPATPEPEVSATPVSSKPNAATTTAPASPSVRRFAREIGIDIGDVPGSGQHGRISIKDVKAYAKQFNSGKSAPIGAGPGPATLPPLPDFTQWGSVQREAMSPVRLKTARHMQLCWTQIPHVTQFNQADVTDLEAVRRRYADRVKQAGGKLTLAVIAVKAVASALKRFPRLNASVDMQNKEIIYKDYVHIGVAVNTPRGLLVPVLRDVDRKNITEIAKEVIDIAEKARNGKLGMDDLTGGTFTLTNLGNIGGTFFSPIINFPEVAILGMGRTYASVATDDSHTPRLILPLSLSYDHRIIDGAEGAAFLTWIVDALEQPLLLSLEG